MVIDSYFFQVNNVIFLYLLILDRPQTGFYPTPPPSQRIHRFYPRVQPLPTRI